MSTKAARNNNNRTHPAGFLGGRGGGTTAGAGDHGAASTARQSTRVGVTAAVSDGAVWHEKLVVCEGTNTAGNQPVIMVRSYYRNPETMEKVWDEPPSGAAAIIHATPEERMTAEEQRTQLELTLQMIPADHSLHDDYNNDSRATTTLVGDATSTKKKGLFGRFRKGGSSSNRRQHPHDRVDISKDVNLQRAIAQSIQETRGGVDDVELAMALSLSVADHKNHELDNEDDYDDDDDDDNDDTHVAMALSSSTPPRLEDLEPTEDELFQRALERSQRETSTRNVSAKDNHDDEDDEEYESSLRDALEQSKKQSKKQQSKKKAVVIRTVPLVASLPQNYGDYADESSSCFDGPSLVPANLSEDELELKMPAKPKALPKFDPYGKK
jgi:hypothetical protein